MKEKKVCAECGNMFIGIRKTKIYCSDNCRVTACQKRKGIDKPEFLQTNYVRKTKDNPKISAIGNIVDNQELELQKLKSKKQLIHF